MNIKFPFKFGEEIFYITCFNSCKDKESDCIYHDNLIFTIKKQIVSEYIVTVDGIYIGADDVPCGFYPIDTAVYFDHEYFKSRDEAMNRLLKSNIQND